MLQLQALDKGSVFRRRKDAGHQGALCAEVHGEGGGLPDMGDRPHILEKAWFTVILIKYLKGVYYGWEKSKGYFI